MGEELLINDLNLSLKAKCYGLIGDNGVGKSTLARLILKQLQPQSGRIVCGQHVGYLSQQTEFQYEQCKQSVAEFLSIQKKLSALQRVAEGSASSKDFELIEDDWLFEQNFQQMLMQVGLSINLMQSCEDLSGGELARLKLFKLFRDNKSFLVLDEPNNHLDAVGKQWLKQQILNFNGGILLISHDLELLTLPQEILHMTGTGIQHYGGNYQDFIASYEQNHQALMRGINNRKAQITQISRTQQKSLEKKVKRSQEGIKQRRSHSQSKSLLDFKKNRSQSNLQGQKQQHERQLTIAKQELGDLTVQVELNRKISLKLLSNPNKQNRVLILDKMIIPFVEQTPIHFVLQRGEKIRLHGRNGSGKSNLLKIISGQLKATSGKLWSALTSLYFDQYYSLLIEKNNLIDNMSFFCSQLNLTEIRTTLASVGFRGDSSQKKVSDLSGGERVRLAIAIMMRLSTSRLILLDEPDNHLDIKSKQLLAQALNDYSGSFILVSHNEYFVREINMHKEILLE